jgi:hypothetical protein
MVGSLIGHITIARSVLCLVAVLCLAGFRSAEGTQRMKELQLVLDGESLGLMPLRDGDRILVPAEAFAASVGAEMKRLTEQGPLSICRGDLCIPLDRDGAETVEVNGTIYAPIEAFAGPLELQWTTSSDRLQVWSAARSAEEGSGVGDLAPDIELPGLLSTERVSLSQFRGRRTVFFVWASW